IYPEGKNDLATVMLERCLDLVASGDDTEGRPIGAGSVVAVTPQNWLFLGAYRALRKKLLQQDTFEAVARPGARAFRAISGEVVNVALPMLTATEPFAEHVFAGIDASEAPDAAAKAGVLRAGEVVVLGQARQLENP